MQETFALLDDHAATPDNPCSRLYTGYHGCILISEDNPLPDALVHMQQALNAGLHAVVTLPYELGYQVVGIPHDSAVTGAVILLFTTCTQLDSQQVTNWLEQQTLQDPLQSPSGISNVQASTSEADFHAAIHRIHDYIDQGHTYQVNYTIRLRFAAHGSACALYSRLRARQPVPYGALIRLPDGSMVLSLSPELFARHHNGTITARPMKGTAPATSDESENVATSLALQQDPKNRAENLMIVDLLRNDLGRLATTGSVAVPSLFDVTRFGQVLQMTSTVTAQLRDDTSLADIITAIFPCGSITGAPKRRTMEIIRELESTPRGLYTGAIGWFAPPQAGQAIGDFCLSVPIRTLSLQPGPGGIWQGEMGVGAGIVRDSDPAAEYAECLLKARFLTALPHAFELFETIRVRQQECIHLDRHLDRLCASAATWHIPLDMTALRHTIAETVGQLLPDTDYRLRISLAHDGRFTIARAPMAALPHPVTVYIAPQAVPRAAQFLRHKSTMRHHFDTAWKSAERQGGFDMLFFNERGELTEGGRSNVFVKLNGHWYTPPLSCGVLPGVMRAVILDDPAWQASERVITFDDLRHADAVMISNALRGAVPAQVDFTACVVDELCISL